LAPSVRPIENQKANIDTNVTAALIIISALLLGTAAVAMTRRNVIHSVLLFVATLAGVAAFYLWAGAEFAAFAQVLVYVGAVSMVVLFAVLLTRPSDGQPPLAGPTTASRATIAITVGAGLAAVLMPAILTTNFSAPASSPPTLTVRQLGLELMGQHGAALLILGVLLTLALIGAVVLASTEPPGERNNPS
jgi:NADH:ubiquinone oxidoreductase subunit 6 (subunit J)